MSQEDIELVISVFTVGGDPNVEMGKLMGDDEHWARHMDKFSPDLEVRFVIPGDAGVEVMEQEFRGIDGLREGWGVWMQPWEEFRVTVDEMIDAGDGKVLIQASAVGLMQGTGAEVPQEVAALSRIEDGRIVAVGYYLDQSQARRDAGLLS
jgi:ketosteroid isomerase-like protein